MQHVRRRLILQAVGGRRCAVGRRAGRRHIQRARATFGWVKPRSRPGRILVGEIDGSVFTRASGPSAAGLNCQHYRSRLIWRLGGRWPAGKPPAGGAAAARTVQLSRVSTVIVSIVSDWVT